MLAVVQNSVGLVPVSRYIGNIVAIVLAVLVLSGASVNLLNADESEPLCLEMNDPRTPCWTKAENHQDCSFRAQLSITPYSPPFTWSGHCQNGKAEGEGVLTDRRGNRGEGRLVAGAEEGLWVRQMADGTVLKNTYEAGVMTGPASVTWANGVHHEGDYLNGYPEGRWGRYWPDGYSEVGEYRKGERHGIWTITWPDGGVALVSYMDGVLHGEMVILENGEPVGTLIYHEGIREGDGLPPILLPVVDSQ